MKVALRNSLSYRSTFFILITICNIYCSSLNTFLCPFTQAVRLSLFVLSPVSESYKNQTIKIKTVLPTSARQRSSSVLK